MATIVQGYTNYILSDAVWTANVAVMATYDVTDFRFLRPSKRIRWNTGTVTITATLPVARRADVMAVPFSNLDPAVLTLTNNGSGGGLSQAIAVPARSPSGFCRYTAWKDLTAFTVGQRTASVWNWVIAANSLNVIMGAALWLSGPIVTLSHALNKGVERPLDYPQSVITSEAGEELPFPQGTHQRGLTGSYQAESEAEGLVWEDFIDSSLGGGYPCFFVRDTAKNDGILGFGRTKRITTDAYPAVQTYDFSLTELNKGKRL